MSTASPSLPASTHQLELALNETIPPLILQSRAAHRRELPRLLGSQQGKWIAYHGDKQVGIGQNKTELVQQCLRRNLKRSEFLVLRIEPEIDQEITVPLDV